VTQLLSWTTVTFRESAVSDGGGGAGDHLEYLGRPGGERGVAGIELDGFAGADTLGDSSCSVFGDRHLGSKSGSCRATGGRGGLGNGRGDVLVTVAVDDGLAPAWQQRIGEREFHPMPAGRARGKVGVLHRMP
jgi:hypothetical protein